MNPESFSVVVSEFSQVIIQKLFLDGKSRMVNVLPEARDLIRDPISVVRLLLFFPDHLSLAMLLIVNKLTCIIAFSFKIF